MKKAKRTKDIKGVKEKIYDIDCNKYVSIDKHNFCRKLPTKPLSIAVEANINRHYHSTPYNSSTICYKASCVKPLSCECDCHISVKVTGNARIVSCNKCNCYCKPQQPMEWSDNFDKTFPLFGIKILKGNTVELDGEEWNLLPKKIKAFISQLLSQREKEIREKIEGMKKRPYSKIMLRSTEHGYTENLYYNQALDDILALLSERKGKE